MADQKRNQQSDEYSRGQQSSQESENTDSESRRTQDNQGEESNQPRTRRDDESTGVGGPERDRLDREPASVADDRGHGGGSMGESSEENLDSELGVESDLDSESNLDEEDDDETGSGR